MRLVDRSTGENMVFLDTFNLPVFSSNRDYIAWISSDKKALRGVKIWDLKNDSDIALNGLFSFDSEILTFEFSDDSKQICTLGNMAGMKRVNIWNVETKRLARQHLFNDYPLNLI